MEFTSLDIPVIIIPVLIGGIVYFIKEFYSRVAKLTYDNVAINIRIQEIQTDIVSINAKLDKLLDVLLYAKNHRTSPKV